MSRQNLNTAIAGSFKFKPEIDAMHEAFADYDVTVLEPTVGWLWLPAMHIAPPGDIFRPLPTEQGMSIRQVEDRFLEAVDRSHFLYVFNQEGYIGPSTAFEMGYAIGSDKPIYMKEAPNHIALAEYDLARVAYLQDRLVVAGVAEVVRLERAKQEVDLDLM